MPGHHTGVHISERLLRASEEWKISDKVVAVVRDNAANMVLPCQLMEDWDDLPCFGHTVQLGVRAGLDHPLISRLNAVCRKIVGHFKHSFVAMGTLREKQWSLNIPQHGLIQDVSTRWNTRYFMYERIAEQHWAIYAVIYDEQVTPSDQRHLDLKPKRWDLLSQLLVVLKPLQVATTTLSKDQNVCSPFLLWMDLWNATLSMEEKTWKWSSVSRRLWLESSFGASHLTQRVWQSFQQLLIHDIII